MLIYCVSSKIKGNPLGIFLLTEGGILDSIQLLIQIKYFSKGELYIHRIIFWEGVYGSIFSILTLISLPFIACPFKKDNQIEQNNYFNYHSFCNGDNLEDKLLLFFSGIKNNVIWFIIYLISCLFYSFLGVFIIKYINAVYKVSIDTLRMFFFIIVLHINNK